MKLPRREFLHLELVDYIRKNPTIGNLAEPSAA
jgi:hypothetical protein